MEESQQEVKAAFDYFCARHGVHWPDITNNYRLMLNGILTLATVLRANQKDQQNSL